MNITTIIKTSYKNMIARSKEANHEAMAETRANETELRIKLELSKIEIEMAEKTNRLSEAAAQYPLNIGECDLCMRDIGMLEIKKNNLTQLLNALFTTPAASTTSNK